MLLPFAKKKGEEQLKTQAPAQAKSYDEFVPYYCHYNPHTLLTKNGELVQIIKIATNTRGLEYESGDTENGALRDMIRQAIVSEVNSDRYAIWIHTFRKRKKVSFATKFKESFADYTYRQWQKKHRWSHQYYNEIYVTILHDGQSTQLLDSKTLKYVSLPKRNRVFRNKYLDDSAQALEQLTNNMIGIIGKHYDARRLSATERLPLAQDPLATHTIFYSEPMEFLGQILNLHSEEHPMPDVDMSVALNTHALTFGFNALETRNAAGKRRFAALLTLKQYREVPSDMGDYVLQAPMEFIISQAFHFTSESEALWQYQQQREFFKISGDDYSVRASGIDEMMQGLKVPLAYGMHQTTIMVAVDDYKHLNAEVAEVQAAFAKLGLITVREDIKLEECFWAQLPGNFEFLRRKDPILTSKLGGFCRLNRFPNGAASHNHWGEPVALMPTTVNSPYFFNFHHKDNGHTAVFDFNSFNDQTGHVLVNFLLSQMRKYDGKIFMFDRDKSAELFFDKLGGQYYRLLPDKDQSRRHPLSLNPLWLEETPRNLSFLLAWCSALLSASMTITEDHKNLLRAAIAQLMQSPPEERNLERLIAIVAPQDAALAEAFGLWHGRGKYAGLLDGEMESLDLRNSLHAFDMDNIVSHPETVIPAFSYLLHRIITSLDGRPTIIVIHEAQELLENSFFAPRLESLLDMLQQSNVMVIFTTKKPLQSIETRTFRTLLPMCGTHIYIPDDIGMNYTSEALGLSAYNSSMLLKMERQKGDFLLKQNDESIGLRANMEGLDDIYAIFSNNIKNLIAAGGEYAALPDLP